MGSPSAAMLNFEEARERILALAEPGGSERVNLSSAIGRVLAEDVVAPRSLPRAPTSAMDGYALCSVQLATAAPYRVEVEGESRAGAPLAALRPGAACRIFTGALLPAGADSVVLQEDVRRSGSWIEFEDLPRHGEHVRQTGEDVAQGNTVLAQGTRLNPFSAGLLAAVERQEVLVGVRPRVAILCTGDELFRPGASVGAQVAQHQIPESNGIAIAALVNAVGGCPELLPPVGDDPALIARALSSAFERCDAVFTIGGVSVGDHDRVHEGLALAGASVDFWKVKIKPGKPLTVATRGRCRVLGLPGNPVSAQVTFCLFGAPLLRRMQGDAKPLPALRSARLAAALEQKPGRTGFYRVRVEGDQAIPLRNQSSGSTVSLALADALAIVPAESSGIAMGERVELLWLRDV